MAAVLDAIGVMEGRWDAALAAMTDAERRAPSFCPGWTQGALAAHLILLAEFAADSVGRGLGGDGGPPPGAASVAEWRAARSARLARLADRSPAGLVAELRDRFARLAPLLVEAASHPDRPAWHSTGTHTAAWWLDHYLFELAIHDWDRRAPADPDAELEARVLPALAPALFARLPRWYGGTPESVRDGVVRLRCEGGSPFERDIRLVSGAATVEAPTGAEPDAVIDADVAALGLVMTARRSHTRYAGLGRWRIDGDRRFGEAFSSAFKPV